jgi:hypothetical protein
MPTGGIQACGGTYSPDGGYTSSCDPTPTCATATDPCSQYPGATMVTCSDNDSGFTGTCCFPQGHPVCTVTSSGASCNTFASGVYSDCFFNCSNSSPADYCPYGSTGTCNDQNAAKTGEDDFTCCFPAGVLPGNGTPASVVDGGLGTGGIIGGGSGSGGLGGIGGNGGGSGGISDGAGGVGPAPTGVGGNPGSGGLFGPGKGGTG